MTEGRHQQGALEALSLPSLSGVTTTLQGRWGFPSEGRGAPTGPASPSRDRLGFPAGHSVSGGLLFITGCFWDNGHLYRADQPSPAPGLRCLNWLEAQSGLASAPASGGECPPRAAGGRRPRSGSWPRPMAPSLPSQTPATTAIAGTRTRTRAGPGATSGARPALPRSGLVRTCTAQVPSQTPKPSGPQSPQAC